MPLFYRLFAALGVVVGALQAFAAPGPIRYSTAGNSFIEELFVSTAGISEGGAFALIKIHHSGAFNEKEVVYIPPRSYLDADIFQIAGTQGGLGRYNNQFAGTIAGSHLIHGERGEDGVWSFTAPQVLPDVTLHFRPATWEERTTLRKRLETEQGSGKMWPASYDFSEETRNLIVRDTIHYQSPDPLSKALGYQKYNLIALNAEPLIGKAGVLVIAATKKDLMNAKNIPYKVVLLDPSKGEAVVWANKQSLTKAADGTMVHTFTGDFGSVMLPKQKLDQIFRGDNLAEEDASELGSNSFLDFSEREPFMTTYGLVSNEVKPRLNMPLVNKDKLIAGIFAVKNGPAVAAGTTSDHPVFDFFRKMENGGGGGICPAALTGP